MSKCYVVYTDYQEDAMILNNLQHNVVINKVFASEIKAIGYVKSELELQCDIVIDPNEKYLKGTEKSSDIWEGRLFEDDEENMLIADIYYENEYQYSIYSKYVEVE